MYGAKDGKLIVQSRQADGSKATEWEKTGEQVTEPGWLKASNVPVNAPTFKFRYFRGSGDKGDVAIDDVKVVQQRCAESRVCHSFCRDFKLTRKRCTSFASCNGCEECAALLDEDDSSHETWRVLH